MVTMHAQAAEMASMAVTARAVTIRAWLGTEAGSNDKIKSESSYNTK
jgi:hypothetical protein